MFEINAWRMKNVAEPMNLEKITLPKLNDNEVLVKVSGCGVCHTDLGFFYDGVKPVKEMPMTLGHEISGFIESAGENAQEWLGKAVIVPAVMPCGECELCKKGRGTICRKQQMPGNHVDGGFASHLVVPKTYLCEVDVKDDNEIFGDSGVTLKELSVIADAITTPYQAVKNAGLVEGDLAIFVGVGGVGGYGVQIAKAFGAKVVAIDIDNRKLEKLKDFGADLILNSKELDERTIKKTIKEFVKESSANPFEWKIFETSGNPAGQNLAYSLLTFGATLSVVGFTMAKLELRLSNLMAYDAKAIGNWGCLPKYYSNVLELVKCGKIQLAPFVQTFPLSEINSVFERSHKHEIENRPILIPDFN
ncbi:MAG: 6-hydroxycyclohex-1-ene-1-carbonyl-CoA dehydrogenase [Calditrichaeota bacterium]|nr:MAG: 6-hydroxycyclohex-1-ene-1-carbonyl-CoA dehydrogenase [Calditrichota bacterium]